MAVVLTRPSPDNEASRAVLQARGFDVLLAPMLRLEIMPLVDDDAEYQAVVATSANALRAIEGTPAHERLRRLPLFAVGDHTAAMARDLGFTEVTSARGDAGALRDCVLQALRGKAQHHALLYLAGADVAHDLAGELAEQGLAVVSRTTYRMIALTALPRAVREAFAREEVEAVLHYSRRSAAAFLAAVRDEGLEITALAVSHCCISSNVASVLHEAGAVRVAIAASPDEKALFDALERALPSRLA